MTAFIFILFYVRDEVAYDRHHEKHERIYRLEAEYSINNKTDRFAITPIPMGPAFKLEFPGVREFTRFAGAGNLLVRHGNREYYENRFFWVDSTVFDVFTHEFMTGNPEHALKEPNTIVLTASTAKKYFGDENPIGKVLKTAEETSYRVTGVICDLPSNAHLLFDALMSGATLAEEQGEDDFNSMDPLRFWNIGVYNYILLHENTDIQTIYNKFPGFYDKYMRPIGDQINASFQLLTTPLAETHFRSGLGGNEPTGNKAYIYIFSTIAVFVILLAAINYMNMATARSTKRAREVGIRKVAGACRGQLIRQFLGESMILSIMAMCIALLAVYLLLPDFNNLIGKTISFASDPAVFLITVGVALVTGILSGTYPAFYLSGFSPVSVLKGNMGDSGKNNGLLRKILVVVQFFIAIVMIIGTIVITHQLDYLKNKDLGFDEENIVVMRLQDSSFRHKGESFKKELIQDPNILGVTRSTQVPGNISWIQVMNAEKEGQMSQTSFVLAQVDYDFIRVMDMGIVKGRDFDKNMRTDDTGAVIINETAMMAMGWEEAPIGRRIDYDIDLEGNAGRPMKVIGVVKDFHFRSLHNPVEPLILFIAQFPPSRISVRINPGKTRESLDFIGKKWNEFQTRRPFDYDFLKTTMDEMYQNEERISSIFSIASVLTLFIALLGLLGLSSFIAEQKTKEIGIRKVLGASVPGIVRLLFREFATLIMIAFFLAVPVAWWRLIIWLQDSFVYHHTIRWYTFLLAGTIALAVGLLATIYHIYRAATANPVDSIKYE